MVCLKLIVQSCTKWDQDKAMEIFGHVGPILSVDRSVHSEEIKQNCLEIIQTLLGYQKQLNNKEEYVTIAGQIIHGCIHVQQQETDAGTSGSKQLRVLSFEVITKFLQLIDDPNVKGFFLPGIVSACSKALHASQLKKAGITAAASGPMIKSLECLDELLKGTLSDASLQQQQQSTNVLTNDDLIEEIRQLGQSPPSNHQQLQSSLQILQVVRDPKWVQQTSEKIDKMFRIVLPPLCANKNPQVRAALATLAIDVLNVNQESMKVVCDCLVEVVLALGQDEFAIVSAPYVEWLNSQTCRTGVEGVVAKLTGSLRGCCEGGELQMQMHCKQLAGALKLVDKKMIGDEQFLRQLFDGLSKCMEFEQSAVGVMLQGYTMSNKRKQGQSNTAEVEEDVSAPVFPEIPLGLRHAASSLTFAAVASVARTLGEEEGAKQSDEFSKQNLELQERIERLQEINKKKNTEANDFHMQITSLKDQLSSQKSEAAKHVQAITQYKDQIQSMQSQVQTANATIEELKQFKTQAEELAVSKSELEQGISQLQQKVEKLEEDKEKLSIEIAQAQKDQIQVLSFIKKRNFCMFVDLFGL
eukprot:TRINITY_DN5543_c0_g2_i3.p1 TRINITY_DN5543_c0_g2~~TRINITY_DN5543_c0_g2_i3.p1  ORF type:complete len:674 (+),score=90.74 TRINITY_DN5543_c0_g2_i3:273-2024(+)